jgi:predicted O-methyltransferase YrrM
MPDHSENYINQWLGYPLPILSDLDTENQKRRDIQPNIGKQNGALLDFLILLTQAKNVLEFGTCLGYSTIYLANALQKTGGHLTAIEFNERLFLETQVNLKKAKLSDIVTLIHADAAETIHTLEGPYDLILQDSNKALYVPMLEDCLKRLRPGGILAADDTLFPVMNVPADMKTQMHAYNQAVFSHSNLRSTILLLGDGITLSLKLS